MSITEQRSTSALLYLSGVTVSFDGFKALNNLSLLVEPGEMRAIIGPNGAGKTTMMDVVTGKTRPDTGEVVFDGKADLTKLDEADIATLGIGRKFQKPTVFENHTVRDNLLLALAGLRSWYRLLLAAPTQIRRPRHQQLLHR
jgi:urea transport system ATP-binding protein